MANYPLTTTNQFTGDIVLTNGGRASIGLTAPSESLETAGNIYVNAENKGLIVDEGGNKRVGFMKYYGREAGIWRNPNQKFEIGSFVVLFGFG